MSWSLETACEADIDELVTWFPTANSIAIWGGPGFRYPFDRESFHQDCRWQEFSSYCLRGPGNELAAFGQLGSRYGRAHLARLVVNPGIRRQGVGRRLLEMMLALLRDESDCREAGLFVLKDNQAAVNCYLELGFRLQEYPDDAPMPDRCYYLSRVVR